MVYDSLWNDASVLVILYDMLLSHHNKSANYRYRPCQCIVNVVRARKCVREDRVAEGVPAPRGKSLEV
jgi:hypothetical protein